MKSFIVTALFSLFLPAMIAAQQSNAAGQEHVIQTVSPSENQQSPKSKNGGMQNMPGMEQKQMPGMQMDENDMMNMHPETFLQEIVHHATSGTSAEPNSTPTPMLMTMRNNWMLMFHANIFVLDEQQNSPRGQDKFFSTNWLMGM